MKRWLISLSLALAAAAAQALPTVNEVEAQVQQGHYAQAQTMMRDVVAAKPGSARAHYVYAEILAHNDRFADAARETATAKRLDPSLAFTDAAKFTAFEQLLDRELSRPTPTPAPRTGSSLDNLGPSHPVVAAAPARSLQAPAAPADGVPHWVWGAGIAALAFAVWRMLSRGRGSAGVAPAPNGMAPGAAPGAAPSPYGYGSYGTPNGYAPNAGGSAPGGSGMLGTGLAAAGGVAAGMLAERFLERGREQRPADNWVDRDNNGYPAAPAPDDDARALENRNVDFGSGNDDWDAGSADTGGSSGSDDGGW
jgi:hypothetical protein